MRIRDHKLKLFSEKSHRMKNLITMTENAHVLREILLGSVTAVTRGVTVTNHFVFICYQN